MKGRKGAVWSKGDVRGAERLLASFKGLCERQKGCCLVQRGCERGRKGVVAQVGR